MLRFITCSMFIYLITASLVVAQQAPPTCEDQLAQTQAQLTLVQTSRNQGEYISADALAAVRKAQTQAQTRVQELETQHATAQMRIKELEQQAGTVASDASIKHPGKVQ